MPKCGGAVELPYYIHGVWSIESPPGTTIYSEEYPEGVTDFKNTLTTDYYSALLLVNGGIGSAYPPGSEITQSVSVRVAEGLFKTLANKTRLKASAKTLDGRLFALGNKIRTKVSTS